MIRVNDVTNSSLLGEDFSNFRLFGIGKETEKQKQRKARRKKKIADMGGVGVMINGFLNKLTMAVPRGAVLTGMRVNIFGLATRLYPAFLSVEEAKKRHFDLPNREKAIEAWVKVKRMWQNLGGDANNLERAIRQGYDKPVFKTKKSKARKEHEQGFDGEIFETELPHGDRLEDAFEASLVKYPSAFNYNPYEDIADGDSISIGYEDQEYSNYEATAVATGAYISAGLSVISALASAVTKSGAQKNPYVDKKIDTTGMDAPPPTEQQQKELSEMEKVAQQDLKNGIPRGYGDLEVAGGDKIMGVPKTAFYVGVGLVALLSAYVIYKKLF